MSKKKSTNRRRQAQKVTGNMPKRRRRLVKFQLDISRDGDAELMTRIDDWKWGREFLPNLRKALWLLISLMEGSIALLAEYFPGIVESIRASAIVEVESQNAALRMENDALRHILATQEARIAELEAQVSQPAASAQFNAILQRLDQLATAQPAPAAAPQPVGGPRQLVTAPVAVPEYDDDDTVLLEVRTDASAGSRASQNFINSLMALAGK